MILLNDFQIVFSFSLFSDTFHQKPWRDALNNSFALYEYTELARPSHSWRSSHSNQAERSITGFWSFCRNKKPLSEEEQGEHSVELNFPGRNESRQKTFTIQNKREAEHQ